MHLSKDSKEFLQYLNSHQVDFIIVGAYAYAYHCQPRLTGDIDILIRSDPANAQRVVDALIAFGFGTVGLSVKDFCEPNQVIQLGYEPNRIDILTSISGVQFDEAWNSKVSDQLDGIPVFFISSEELIRNKRATGRPKDILDVEMMRKVQSVGKKDSDVS